MSDSYINTLIEKVFEEEDASTFSSKKEPTCFVFKTSLQSKKEVDKISEVIESLPGILEWSVDLDNWEKVLRIVCVGINASEIAQILRQEGVQLKKMATGE